MSVHQSLHGGLSQEQLDAYWMPYTGNRQFKRDPRIIVGAEGMGKTRLAAEIACSTASRDCGPAVPATAARRSPRP